MWSEIEGRGAFENRSQIVTGSSWSLSIPQVLNLRSQLVTSSFSLQLTKLKGKILRKSARIPLHCLIQYLRRDAVELGQVTIQHDSMVLGFGCSSSNWK